MLGLIVSVVCQGAAVAGTHWVTPNGAAVSWAACQSTAPLAGPAGCTVTQANANAMAGDTVYYRDGTYTLSGAATGIRPAQGGTGASAKLIFAAYAGDTPVFTQSDSTDCNGVIISGKNWIVVTGFTFQDLRGSSYIINGNYNEVSYNKFVNTTTAAQQTGNRTFVIGAGIAAPWSTHNWFHHNYLSSRANSNPCGEGTDLLRIGMAQGGPNYSEDNYNTVEDNYLEYSGHANLVTYGRFNVIRRNIMHNEPWITGCRGYQGGSDAYYANVMGTSSTSIMTLGTGSHSLIVSAGLNTSYWKSGAFFTISAIDSSTGLPLTAGMGFGGTHSGWGTITSYDSGTGALVVNVANSLDVIGSGTYSNWAVYLSNIPAYDDAAYNGLYSHRVACIGDNTNPEPNYNLIEGNRIGHAGVNPHNNGANALDLEQSYNIVRYNFIYNAMGGGLTSKTTAGKAYQNYSYNNTLYHNGWGYNWNVFSGNGNAIVKGGIVQNPAYGHSIWKNNLIYGSGLYTNGAGDLCSLNSYYLSQPCTPAAGEVMAGNWISSSGNPKFVNPDLAVPTSQNLFSNVHGYATTPIPNLTLQSASPAIDQGTHLAVADGGGANSTVLGIKSATGAANELCPSCYFQDGTWGSDLSRAVNFLPDWIAIGTVTNVVQIRSVNYATNTITLAAPVTWSDQAKIWLYKKSDGAVVLAGAAPDPGASEFIGSTPQAPTNLRIIR